MPRRLLALIALALAVPAAADDAKLRVKRAAAAPPDELAAPIRDLLAKDRDAVLDDAGNVVAEVWFRAEVPVRATADQIANGLTYREVTETTVLAAVLFPKPFVDYRKQEIPAGVYTLRLAFQPDTGDHTDTAPHTEFALLVPADKDRTADTTEPKTLYKMSMAATGGDHPGVMLLFPNHDKVEGPKLADRGNGVWTLNLRRPAAADDGKATIGFALTVAGVSKVR